MHISEILASAKTPFVDERLSIFWPLGNILAFRVLEKLCHYNALNIQYDDGATALYKSQKRRIIIK